ncbi:MAG: hypothetical protein RLZ86_1482 [Actinomycetota bacterium]
MRQTGVMPLTSRRPRSSTRLAAIALASLVIASCANRDEATPAPTEAPATSMAPSESTPDTTVAPDSTTAPEPTTVTFGDLASPCGPAADGATPTVLAAEAGGSPDRIRLAAASDKGNIAVPGLNAELYDAAVAFAGWCNAQGGIAGLPVEIIDADSKLFEVPAQMEAICDNAFAMAGGGFAFDDQEFPRFHECDMIDFAGFVVTAAKSKSDNMFTPMPNPSDFKDGGWFKWALSVNPEAMQSFGTVYSDLLTAQIVEEQYVELIEKIGGIEVDIRVPYSSLGEANWVPIAQQLKSRDIRALAFVGVPEVLPQLTKAMDELNYRPDIIMADAGFYADVLLERGGASVEGVFVRTAYSLIEEADRVPAVRDYLDMIDEHRPGGKVSGLGMQGLSAMFLFATAAKPCVESGELSRACVVEQASGITSWTGGGLHAPADPGTNTPSPCYQMIVVKDGTFTRSYPPVPPSDADRALVPTVEITDDGWACDDSTLLPLDGDYGDTTLGLRP